MRDAMSRVRVYFKSSRMAMTMSLM
jgi:hypothetical protein